jgi:hypothetical protein
MEEQQQVIPSAELGRRPAQIARRTKLLRLAAQGLNAKQAANVTGIPYATVLAEYGDEEFRAQTYALVNSAFSGVDGKVADFNLTLHDRIRLQSEKAFEKLCELMDDDTTHPAIVARIAQDFLDRNPESQSGSTMRIERIEADHLALAAKAAKEMDNVIPIKPRPLGSASHSDPLPARLDAEEFRSVQLPPPPSA